MTEDFVTRLRAEWEAYPPALQAAAEGKTTGLQILISNAVEIARQLRDALGEVDPSAQTSLLIVLCANAYKLVVEPKPTTDICQVLAVAAIRVMELEDEAMTLKGQVEILRTGLG